MRNNPDTNDHRLKALFGEALGTKPTSEQTEQVWHDFIGQRRKTILTHHSLYVTIASAAALLLLMLVLWPLMDSKQSKDSILVFTSLEAPKEITYLEVGERVEIRTPAGITKSLILSDGTEVLLSANSRLEYSKFFSVDKREVTLVGEARFSVAKEAKRPFIVRTELLQTQVLGTVFDVKAYPATAPDVTLYEGCVEVSLNGASSQRMQPGEQVSLNKEGKLKLAKASVTQGKWAEGEFAFDNKELMDAMIEIGSWYNISVAFQHHHLLNERIYFRMERPKHIEDVLRVLNDIGIAKFEMKNEKIIVSKR
ncbi:MAG: FecR domain-containing protein [Parabacteroides sp.]|nr:FecR domain-containing protein [Parabacteroides sp.]